MDIGLDDEGVDPHALRRLRNQLMPLGDDRVVDAFQGLWAEQTDVVTNAVRQSKSTLPRSQSPIPMICRKA